MFSLQPPNFSSLKTILSQQLFAFGADSLKSSQIIHSSFIHLLLVTSSIYFIPCHCRSNEDRGQQSLTRVHSGLYRHDILCLSKLKVLYLETSIYFNQTR